MNFRAAGIRNSVWLWPAVIAALAGALVLMRLDPAGDHPGGWDGPGMTVDESFNVDQGARLVDRLFAGDMAGFQAVDAQLPDHPPLGRLWIGLCHELAILCFPPVDPRVPYSVTCARTAPAAAFAATVLLVGWFTGRRYGRSAGAFAAASMVLMPRTFGHAHLAALESCINLAYAAAVFYVADRWAPATGRSYDESPGTEESGTRKAESRPDDRRFPLPGYRTALVGDFSSVWRC